MQFHTIAFSFIYHRKGSAFRCNGNVLRLQVCCFVNGISQYFPSRFFHHKITCGIINIDDTLFAPFKEHTLGDFIIFHGFMIIQMILCQVGEHCHLISNAVHTMQIQRMGRNFHHHICHIFLTHLFHQCLQFQRFRRCPFCGNDFISNAVFDGADDACFSSYPFQHRTYQIGDGGFAVGAGHPCHTHFLCGMVIKICRQRRQCLTVVFCLNHHDVFRYIFHSMFYQKGCRTFFQRHRNIAVTVCLKSCDADKQIPWLYFSGIVNRHFDFHLIGSL